MQMLGQFLKDFTGACNTRAVFQTDLHIVRRFSIKVTYSFNLIWYGYEQIKINCQYLSISTFY